MATKLRNKNQRTITPANRLDKQDPLDLGTLNSEPKGKTKSKNSRLRERQEREKLLQQHRSHQQESLKRKRERDRIRNTHPSAEHYQTNEDTQNKEPRKVASSSSSSTAEAPPDVLDKNQQPGPKVDAYEDPVPKSTDHDEGSTGHDYDEVHGALGDSILRNVKSDRERCTNCCGRLQVLNQDQYSLEHINVENEPRRPSCRCHRGQKAQIHCKKTLNSDYCEATDADEHLEASSSKQQTNFKDENEIRLRGGCGGGCGGSGGTRNSACCPCGGCGGAACTTNTNCDNRPASGCCGGNQPRGLPCRCVCRSCSNPCPPCGSCGGQNCGKWNSCAGSGGGKCCFPRNTRKRNGPGCCSGGNGSCGGCGSC